MSKINNQSNSLDNIDFVQDISSETAAVYSGGADLVYLYKDSNLRGPRIAVTTPGTRNVGLTGGRGPSNGFNDTVSSIDVKEGRWLFYVDSNYRGRRFVAGPGKWNVPASYNDKITSLRPIG